MNFKLFIKISITLLFFSTSSVLARAALLENLIDAYSFTLIRLGSGALVLYLIFYIKNKKFDFNLKSNWSSSFFLFLYAICFSYSYINLDAGVGALILFAIVQLLILLIAILKKELLNLQKTLGLFLAFGGLFYLLYPSGEIYLSSIHVFLMIIAGLAWGFYTILGKSSKNALYHTADNFIKSILFVLLFYFLFVDTVFISFKGALLAFVSGGITSAIGYALWYNILPKITIIASGVVQLIVPPIAIFLGIIFLNEEFTFKLFLATNLILLGIFIAIINKKG